MSRPADDKRFTFGLIWDVAEVLRRHGYPIPQHRGRDDHGDIHRETGQALFRLIYTDTDLGTRQTHETTPPPDLPGRDQRGVEL